jgi:hypothetical protein
MAFTTGRLRLLVSWFDDCSKIGNIGYIIEWQWFSRQHFGNMKSYKKQHFSDVVQRLSFS